MKSVLREKLNRIQDLEDIEKFSDEEFFKLINSDNDEYLRNNLINACDVLCLELYDKNINEINPFYLSADLEELKKFKAFLITEKKLKKEAQSTAKNKYKLKTAWKNWFNKIVLKQPKYAVIYFYAAMSCIFFHDFKLVYKGIIDEDIRVHPALICPTGVGKSFSNNLLAKFVRQIPKRIYRDINNNEITEFFKVEMPSKFTDAGLIGNLDADLYKRQKEKNILPFIEKNGVKYPNPKYIDPLFEGSLKRGDLVIFDEARKVFMPNRDSTEVQVILCNAMNNYGSETNILANDSASSKSLVNYYCSAVIVLTSIPVNRFDDLVYEGGLLQRMSILIDSDDGSKRKAIRDDYFSGHINDGADVDFDKIININKQQEQELINEVIKLKKKTMKYTQTWEPETRTPMLINKDVAERARTYCNNISNNTFLSVVQQDKHESNISRLMRKILIYSSINAISEGRNRLEVSDVDEAYLDMVVIENDSMLDFLRQNLVNTKEDADNINRERKLKLVLSRGKKIKKMDLINIMCREWNLSQSTTSTYLKKFKRRGIYTEVREGNVRFCKLK